MSVRRWTLAGAIAMLLVTATAAPAAAYTVKSASGTYGDYGLTDTTDAPAVTCTYGQPQPPFATAWLHKVKVRAPMVTAVDANPAVREHQRASWQWKLQGEVFGSGDNWQTFAQSAVQKVTAYDDTFAPFSPMSVSYNANHNPDPNKDNFVFRTLIILRWYKANGAIQGTVKLLPTYYRIKGPFSPPFTGGGDYCGAINTAG